MDPQWQAKIEQDIKVNNSPLNLSLTLFYKYIKIFKLFYSAQLKKAARYGSGLGSMRANNHRIQLDPDPQHCIFFSKYRTCMVRLKKKL